MHILLITSAAFVMVLLVFYGLFLVLTAPERSVKSDVRRRLQTIAMRQSSEEVMSPILKSEIMSAIPAVNRILYGLPLAARVERLLEQADVKVKVETFFLLDLALLALGLLIGLVMNRGLPVALLAALISASTPFVYLSRKRHERIRKFTALFPDALDMIGRSLRAGHSFLRAMQIVSTETPEPVSKLFRMAYDEQALGLPLAESLNNMTNRISSIDLNFFVTAVNIHRESGGNLAEILEKLGITIRERFKVIGQLAIYTAQGRMSGIILSILPLALATVLWLINPDYLKVLLKNRIGMYMVVGAALLQITGALVIKKIIHIKI
ncbi:MAG: type II secretion system F family protein [Nitrospirota bacterium]